MAKILAFDHRNMTYTLVADRDDNFYGLKTQSWLAHEDKY